MKVAFKDHRGFYGTTWDGQQMAFNREAIGEGETFELVVLDVPEPPQPPVVTYPPYSPNYVGSEREWFSVLVFGKPFGQQTLLDLEPTFKENGWLLTPPNANGERAKVAYQRAPLFGVSAVLWQWVRVGFGEGVWVWVEQP